MTKMTLYHKIYVPLTRTYSWQRYLINLVSWQGGKGANINKGYDKANDINVFIHYKDNSNLCEIPIEIGDIIVKGECDSVITKQSDLTVDNYNITTIINNDEGSNNVRHIYLGAK